MNRLLLAALLLTITLSLRAEDAPAEDAPVQDAPSQEAPAEAQGDGVKSPKTLSGMSILGNEEAPKSLVIIPWKSSELGDEIGLEDTLDDRARPVDKEVFLRELRYFDIRSGKEPVDTGK